MTLVRYFHEAFDHPHPDTPPLRPDPDLVRLRMRLIREEYEEVKVELEKLLHVTDPDKAIDAYRALLKELADLRYVVDGCAVALGLPIDDAFYAVHLSNMSKLDENGKPVYREDGKVIKSDRYEPPNMALIIEDIYNHEED